MGLINRVVLAIELFDLEIVVVFRLIVGLNPIVMDIHLCFVVIVLILILNLIEVLVFLIVEVYFPFLISLAFCFLGYIILSFWGFVWIIMASFFIHWMVNLVSLAWVAWVQLGNLVQLSSNCMKHFLYRILVLLDWSWQFLC